MTVGQNIGIIAAKVQWIVSASWSLTGDPEGENESEGAGG
jgi:hypothetical protein